ncbi:unnamed protein product [Rhizophagus irregularis]|nr:unnamed protein product [Rhizophagus irregularis]
MASTCLQRRGFSKTKGSFRRIQLGKTKRFFWRTRLRKRNDFSVIPDVWMIETNWNAGRNFWVKDPWLRLQDEISKFIFWSPSVRKNFEGSRMPFQHFEG